LKPERWGSLLVQENNQEEKACDKRRIITIIISGLCMLILVSVAIPGSRNVIKKGTEIWKYKDLIIEIQCM
jgi:hypothetical protein